MRKRLVVVLAMLCVLAFCMAPAAASSFDFNAKSSGMTVTPIIGDVAWPKSSNTDTISQGGTKRFTYDVPLGSTKVTVRVAWGNTANNLGLTVRTPDGISHGEFYDSSDGTTNGNIALQFQETPFQCGQWLFFVNGVSLTGTQQFTITIVSS